MESLDQLWEDQAKFNKNFFVPTKDIEDTMERYQEQSRQTKEFVLHMISELDELLRCTVWKLHRKQSNRVNLEQVKNELTDIFKYYISLCQVWNIEPPEVIEDYWRKSMVVRQRYSEEYLNGLEGDIVVCDIDGVLADYVNGIIDWISLRYPYLRNRCAELSNKHVWVNAETLNVDEQVWQEIKHRFRVERGKVQIKPYLDADRFLKYCSQNFSHTVLLTSRPIDAYPNIYTDTLEWLKKNNLSFSHVWWAIDKGEKLLSAGILPKIAWAIDDDLRYIKTYNKLGIKSIYINGTGDQSETKGMKNVWAVSTIYYAIEIMRGESEK